MLSRAPGRGTRFHKGRGNTITCWFWRVEEKECKTEGSGKSRNYLSGKVVMEALVLKTNNHTSDAMYVKEIRVNKNLRIKSNKHTNDAMNVKEIKVEKSP